MLSRRTFGTASAFAAATLAALPGQEAKASSAAPVNIDPRGDIGRLRRMPKLEQESKLDFLVSAGQWINTGGGTAQRDVAERACLLRRDQL
jgi:hypothetical protein